MATELGETGHENMLKRELGGKGEASRGGGSLGGNTATVGPSIGLDKSVGLIGWWQDG
jgi:hypothetical protein